MMRILIADDEPLALSRLQTLLAEIDGVEVVGLAHDGDEAAALIHALKPDLALLDIRMPKQSGLSLARAVETVPDVEVVFVTAYDHFAAQAFAVDAVDYLLKPVEPARLAMAIARARRRREGGQQSVPQVEAPETGAYADGFWAPGANGLVRVDISSIDWIEAARDYALLHTSTRSHIVRTTMGALQKQLDPDVMVRVSRSAFVRRSAIGQVTRQGGAGMIVVLRDGTPVRVGATYGKAGAALGAALA
jgi:two-component system LytT family response regulator